MSSPILLILTVGTDTAGRESFIAEGLRRTVELIQPRRYWLVPSTSPASIDVADFIREHFPDTFAPWDSAGPYLTITNPDSLENCRARLREIITAVRPELRKKERLIVNPTSGTKQMSAGATIAALDEHVGELVFTIGDRADGVVRTGTERLESFDASSYFAEKSFEQAAALYEVGAYQAASMLLGTYPQYRPVAALCRCIHEWERQNYSDARDLAQKSGHQAAADFVPFLKQLAHDGSCRRPSPAIIADLMRSAKALQNRGENEASLLRTCKALEIGLRLELSIRLDIHEPYRPDSILKPGMPPTLRKRVAANAASHSIHLSFRDLVDLLLHQGSEVAHAYESTTGAKKAVKDRNNLAHQLGNVSSERAFNAIGAMTEILKPLALPIPPRIPSALPPCPPA